VLVAGPWITVLPAPSTAESLDNDGSPARLKNRAERMLPGAAGSPVPVLVRVICKKPPGKITKSALAAMAPGAVVKRSAFALFDQHNSKPQTSVRRVILVFAANFRLLYFSMGFIDPTYTEKLTLLRIGGIPRTKTNYSPKNEATLH
jgi:hypothetical protein